MSNVLNTENTIKAARALGATLQEKMSFPCRISTGAKGDWITIDGVDTGHFVCVDFTINKVDSYKIGFKSRKEQCDWLRKKLADY